MTAKLVRDNIPAIIKATGRTPRYRVALEENRINWLKMKLREEALEVYDDPCAEELGDVLEVIEALIEELGITWKEVERAKIDKKNKNGGFNEMYILEGVE